MGPLQLNSDTSSKVAQSSLPLPGFKKEQTESLQNFLTSSVAAALQQHTSFVEELPKFQSPLLEVQDPGVVTAIEVSFQTCKEPFSPGDVASAHVEVNRPKGEPKAEEVMSLKKYQGASVLWGAKAAKIEKSKRKADSLDESSLPAPKKARLTETAITQLEPDPDGPNAQPKVAHEILPICSDICGWLPADGVPGRAHLINVDSYLQSTGKPVLTMGDIVATILYNYSPGLLDAFFAINHKLEVSFTRNENAGSEHLDFCIERFDSTVYCGFLKSQDSAGKTEVEPAEEKKPKKTKQKAWNFWNDYMEETDKCAVGKWDTRFTYKMKPRGKWVPMTGSLKNKKKKEIEKLASEFGVHVFEAQKWAQDEGVSFKVIGY